MPRRPTLAALVLAVVAASACGAEANVSMSGGGMAGDPISPPPRPDDAWCEAAIREDPSVMVTAREGLASGLDSSLDAATAAARDPGADVFTYGIPLTRAELAMLEEAAVAPDPHIAMATQLAGARISMIGVDERSGEFTVAIADDAAALARIQCFEPESLRGLVHYVTDRPSLASGQRAMARIRSEIGELRSAGIPVTEVWLGAESPYVTIEIRPFSESAGQALIDRYGGIVQVSTDNGIPGQ